MKISTYGILREKLDHSGINGAPIVTDIELSTLRREIESLIDLAKDIEDQPLKQFFNRELTTVENIIEARSTKY